MSEWEKKIVFKDEMHTLSRVERDRLALSPQDQQAALADPDFEADLRALTEEHSQQLVREGWPPLWLPVVEYDDRVEVLPSPPTAEQMEEWGRPGYERYGFRYILKRAEDLSAAWHAAEVAQLLFKLANARDENRRLHYAYQIGRTLERLEARQHFLKPVQQARKDKQVRQTAGKLKHKNHEAIVKLVEECRAAGKSWEKTRRAVNDADLHPGTSDAIRALYIRHLKDTSERS